jgi:tetratricopeptide (TPR) repeat protein
LAVLVSVIAISALAQNEATAGQAAEQSGKPREALTHYVAALQSIPEGSDDDQQLREKIVALAQKLKPAPTLPEEARTHFGRGQAAVEIAKDPDDFRRAAAEFQQVLKLAPWFANGYFNLGKVQDKSGQHVEAIRSFKLYLLAAPSATDADDVKTRIAGLEYKIERSKEEARAQQKKAQQEASAKQAEEDRRAAEAERQRRDEERGIWIDRTTGLMWTYKNSDSDVTPNLAANICQNLSVGGYSGWRLPEISELEGIYASGQETIKTRLRGTGGSGYTWSATRNGSGEPWMFGFPETWRPTGRRVLNNVGHIFIYRTLCVRRSGE